jgi:hypothetical protein
MVNYIEMFMYVIFIKKAIKIKNKITKRIYHDIVFIVVVVVVVVDKN